MTPPALGKTAGRGAIWISATAVVTKAVGGLSYLALAAFLDETAFGVVGLAYTLIAFARVVEQFGVREVLIRHREDPRETLGAGLVVAVAASGLAGALAALAAPVFAEIWDEPDIIGPVIVLAASMPITGAATALSATVERDLRFAAVAAVAAAGAIMQAGLAIALAWAGAGPYAFVLPLAAVAILRAAAFAIIGTHTPSLRAVRAKLPLFATATAPIFIAAIATTLTREGDRALLGDLATTAAVGYYFFAYTQSTQIAQILVSGFIQVLLPTLSAMGNDVRRQAAATIETARLLALPSAGLCIAQAAAVGPVLRLLFGERWTPAIPIFIVLSFAAAPAMACWHWQSLPVAQGRYWYRVRLLGWAFAGFFLCVLTAVAVDPVDAEGVAMRVALGVCVHRLLSGPILLAVVCRSGGVPAASAARATGGPVLVALLCIALPWQAVAGRIPDLAILAVVAAGSVLYVYALRALLPGAFGILTRRLVGALPRAEAPLRLLRLYPG